MKWLRIRIGRVLLSLVEEARWEWTDQFIKEVVQHDSAAYARVVARLEEGNQNRLDKRRCLIERYAPTSEQLDEQLAQDDELAAKLRYIGL